MRRLFFSTVMKRLKKEGFSFRDESIFSGILCEGQYTPSTRISVEMDGWMIKFFDARWHRRSNVHIVSYFNWPSNLKDLEEMVEGVREIYTELCHTRME